MRIELVFHQAEALGPVKNGGDRKSGSVRSLDEVKLTKSESDILYKYRKLACNPDAGRRHVEEEVKAERSVKRARSFTGRR